MTTNLDAALYQAAFSKGDARSDGDISDALHRVLQDELQRLGELFPVKTKVTLLIDNHSLGNYAVALMLQPDKAPTHICYGKTFPEAVEQVETYAADYVIRYRPMVAADIGFPEMVAA